MPILSNPPASAVPAIDLIHWAVIQTEREEMHFVGYSIALGHARVSSPIATFDPSTRSGATSTGRRYTLVGAPGLDGDGLYILNAWLAGYQVPEWRDITAAFATTGKGDSGC